MYYDITQEQHEVLLRPLNGSRVAKRKQAGQSLSYLEAWDVKAHMIRIFGFGGWSWNVTQAEVAFEDTVVSKSGGENWNVGYKVVGTLSVAGATYTEAAVGSATLPSRGDAHDMACKTAESDAFKRAAINLGDQFGLGLYNGGQLVPVVKATLYGPEQQQRLLTGLQAAVAAVGDLEVVPVVAAEEPEEDEGPSHSPEPDEAVSAPEIDTQAIVDRLRELALAGDVAGIVALKASLSADGSTEAIHDGKTIAKYIDLAVVHAGKATVKADLGAEEVQA